MDILHQFELCIYRFIVKFYRLNNSILHDPCTGIVPHGYGLSREGKLLTPTKQSVWVAIRQARALPRSVSIFLVSTGYWPEERDLEESIKCRLLEQQGIKNPIVLVKAGARNTIDEVRETSRVLGDSARSLIIVCEEAQMRSAKIIWEYFRPKDHFRFIGFEGEWIGEHRSFWIQSPLRWLIANWIRHLLLIIQGVDKAGKHSHQFQQA